MHLLFHASARSMPSHTVTKQHPLQTVYTVCFRMFLCWLKPQYNILIWICYTHDHQVHVFTRLICLFVKQMVLMCLRGRLLLLLRWHNIPIKTISRSCVPNEPSKLILKAATRQWFGHCVYLFGLQKYVTLNFKNMEVQKKCEKQGLKIRFLLLEKRW